MIRLIDQEENNTLLADLAELETINESTHDHLVDYIYKQYSKDVSTPLNVIREIYSSNKALINAMKEFKLDMDNLSTFDIVPTLVR